MADKKISAFTTFATMATGDFIPFDNISEANATRNAKITLSDFKTLLGFGAPATDNIPIIDSSDKLASGWLTQTGTATLDFDKGAGVADSIFQITSTNNDQGIVRFNDGTTVASFIYDHNVDRFTFDTVGQSTALRLDGASSIATLNLPLKLDSYTVAGLPTPSTANRMIWVSDETGGATMAIYDGTNWRRMQDYAVVA